MGITIRTQPMRMLAATAIAGGVALLSACGQGANDIAGGAPQGSDIQPAAEHNTKNDKQAGSGNTPEGNGSTPGTASDLTPSAGDVECGHVDAGQLLVAKERPAGTVGCTEAFNVLDEFRAADRDQAETGTIGATRLESGWSCASVPDPEVVGVRVVYCSDGEDDGYGGYVGGRAFYTTPADRAETGDDETANNGDGKGNGNNGTGQNGNGGNDNAGDVNCGAVGEDQSLWAKETPAGTVGCTEAFNVLDAYGKAPIDPNSGTMREVTLDSGWTCATVPDTTDASKRVITCGEGEHGRSLYTKVN